MFYIQRGVVYFTLFHVLCFVQNLVGVPAIEDNNLELTEAALRQTFNNLFITFNIKDFSHNPRLKEFLITHNFFISITLNDGENLKKIAQLSQVYDLDSNTLYFMTQINEVLNESDKSNDVTNGNHVNRQILKFIDKLRGLKRTYTFNRNFANYTIKENIIKHLNNTDLLTNISNNNNEEIWKPTESSGRRIFQGHRTRIKHYPFVVSVHFFKRFQCAGSIIEKDLVVTAASCLQLAHNNRFFRENPAFLSVQIGSNFYEASGENIPVSEIYFHPEYTPNNLANNIAVMRLTIHIQFSKRHKNVRKVEFDRSPTPLSVNTDGIIIVGWGARDRTNAVYDPWLNKLNFAELSYYSLLECQKVYSKEYVTQKNFCAGFFSKAGGACQHDIGGPGLAAGILVGVISFGPPTCGTPDAPTVFTKVGFYAEWIEDIIDMPVPVFAQKTTLRQSKVTIGPLYSRTTKHFHFGPMATETDEVTNAPYDTPKKSLRILGDKKLFKEFLTTLFSKDNEDYSESSYDEMRERETTKFVKRKATLFTSSSTPFLPVRDKSKYSDEIRTENGTKMKIDPEPVIINGSVTEENLTLEKDISKKVRVLAKSTKKITLPTTSSSIPVHAQLDKSEYIDEETAEYGTRMRTDQNSIRTDFSASGENSKLETDISKIRTSGSNEKNMPKMKSNKENISILKSTNVDFSISEDYLTLEKDISESKNSESDAEYVPKIKPMKENSTTVKSLNVDVSASEENSRIEKNIFKLRASGSKEKYLSKIKSIDGNMKSNKENTYTLKPNNEEFSVSEEKWTLEKDISEVKTSESEEEYVPKMKTMKERSMTVKSLNMNVSASEENSTLEKKVFKLGASGLKEKYWSKIKSNVENDTTINTNLSAEEAGSDDSKLEKDIMELLDDINIRKILGSEEALSTSGTGENRSQFSKEENISINATTDKKSRDSIQTASFSSDESRSGNNEGSDFILE